MFRSLDQRRQNFYNKVANMIKRINQNLSTIKLEIYKTTTPERYYTLLHKVLINYDLLRDINKQAHYMKNIPLGCVMIFEILTGHLKNDGFRRKFKKLLGNRQLIDIYEQDIYIRMNMQKGTVEDLQDLEYKETEIDNVFKILNIKNSTQSIKKYIVTMLKTKVKIQSFESCLPVHFLSPEPGSIVIDATAAPGNKTTQCADKLNNTGKILAVEKDKNRFQILQTMIKDYGCTNVEVVNRDFLDIEPSSITPDYIIVDPTCSGSGIHVNYKKNEQRIEKLKNFQFIILNHALKFNAKKIVYSVCSIHPEEGEEVIKEILEKNPQYTLQPIAISGKDHGCNDYDFCDKVVRSKKELEKATGFFVCVLVNTNR